MKICVQKAIFTVFNKNGHSSSLCQLSLGKDSSLLFHLPFPSKCVIFTSCETHTHTHTADKQSNTPTHGRRGVTNLLVWSGGLREVHFLEGAR